jgi:hypothetical protein
MVDLNPLHLLRGNPEKKQEVERILREIQGQVASAESHPAANVQSDLELQRDLAQSYYLQVDNLTLELIKSDPQLSYLVPAFSHLNRTSKIPDKRLAEMARLDIEYILLLHELNASEDELELSGWAKLEALRIFGLSSVNDQLEGYRGKLVTEKIKEVRVRLEQKKKEGIL